MQENCRGWRIPFNYCTFNGARRVGIAFTLRNTKYKLSSSESDDKNLVEIAILLLLLRLKFLLSIDAVLQIDSVIRFFRRVVNCNKVATCYI